MSKIESAQACLGINMHQSVALSSPLELSFTPSTQESKAKDQALTTISFLSYYMPTTLKAFIDIANELIHVLEKLEAHLPTEVTNEDVAREVPILASRLHLMAATIENKFPAPSLVGGTSSAVNTEIVHLATSPTQVSSTSAHSTGCEDVPSSLSTVTFIAAGCGDFVMQQTASCGVELFELRLVTERPEIRLVSPLLFRCHCVQTLFQRGWRTPISCGCIILGLAATLLKHMLMTSSFEIEIEGASVSFVYQSADSLFVDSALQFLLIFLIGHVVHRGLLRKILGSFEGVLVLGNLLVLTASIKFNILAILHQHDKLHSVYIVGTCLQALTQTGFCVIVVGFEAWIMAPRAIRKLAASLLTLCMVLFFFKVRLEQAYYQHEVCFWFDCTSIKTVIASSLGNCFFVALKVTIGMYKGHDLVMLRGRYQFQTEPASDRNKIIN